MPHKDIYRGGKRLVSVTELTSIISKPFLDKWKEKLCCPSQSRCGFVEAKKIAEEAATLGNTVHEQVAAWLLGGTTNDLDKWFYKIKELYEAHKVSPYLIDPEQTLIDEESGLAGSPDAVIHWDGVPYIADLKIKNSLDALTGMQGQGYRYLVRRKYGVDIPRMKVIHCQKKTVAQSVKPVDIDLNEWEKPWHTLVDMWNIINPSRYVKVIHG